MPTFTQDNRFLKLDTPLGPDVLLIRSFACSERISGLYSIQVSVAATPENVRQVKASELIGKDAVITMFLLDDEPRFFHGLIRRLVFTGKDNDLFYFNLEIVPWFWLLTQTTDCRIYQEKTVPEIVELLLGERGCPAFEFNLTKPHTAWDYCVQYRETFFQFIARMLEQEGMFFYFKHGEDQHTLIIADNPAAHESCPINDQYRFIEAGIGVSSQEDMVHHWEVNEQLRPGKFTMRDHHFQIPSNDLQVSEPSVIEIGGNHNLEIYDYPGEYSQLFVQPDQRLGKVKEEGLLAVRRRMLAEEAAYKVVSAASTAKSALSGYKFELTNHFQRDFNKEYLITSVQHNATQSPDYVNNQPVDQPYRNSFHCILAETPFVPARATPKPTVMGPQTAVVVGPAGEEIYTDKYGRVKVQFFWDRYAKGDETSSGWIRVSTPWGGQNWGGVAVPRIGQEVIVDFIEGDPDQPIITGRFYNAEQMPPYPLPGQCMVSGMKTNSTPGGGGYNEMIMDDTKGKEMVRIHAQYDMSTTVEHDDTQTIHNNRTITVDGTHTETIDKATSITIKTGPYSLDVQNNTHTHHVKGAVTENYDATQDTTVASTIQIKSTGSHIYVEAANHIELHTGSSNMIMKKDGSIRIDGKNIEIIGTTEVKLGVGTQTITLNNQGIESAGAKITSSAVGVHEISGALIKIN